MQPNFSKLVQTSQAIQTVSEVSRVTQGLRGLGLKNLEEIITASTGNIGDLIEEFDREIGKLPQKSRKRWNLQPAAAIGEIEKFAEAYMAPVHRACQHGMCDEVAGTVLAAMFTGMAAYRAKALHVLTQQKADN